MRILPVLFSLAAIAALATPVAASDRAEADRGTFTLPPGHVAVLRFAGGGIEVGTAPADSPRASAGNGAGTLECLNDVLAPGYWSDAPLAPNLLAPMTQNRASEGACRNTDADGDWHDGPVTLLQLRAAGDGWGSALLEGVAADGRTGEFRLYCGPTAAGGGVGAAGAFLHFGQAQDATCEYTSYGAQPSAYAAWNGVARNGHYTAGTVYAAVN